MNTTRIEPLENRIAPAGLVLAVYDAATGELTLTDDGGGLANTVNVFQTGPNSHRVEGVGTDINVAATTFLDIGKLTKLTIDGGGGGDIFTLANLRTLTALSFSGGAGNDELNASNLTVKGNVEIHGNAGGDFASFTGLSTEISGNLTADSAAAAADGIDIQIQAQKTMIGGSVLFTGGGGSDSLDSFGSGSVRIAKGVNFNTGAGGGGISLDNEDLLTIGKLATGESILLTGGDGDDDLSIGGVNATLTGGIRMTGGALDDVVNFNNNPGAVKIGKLPTGESILFDGGTGNDRIFIDAGSLTMAGAIDFAAGEGGNRIELSSPGGATKLGKLATGQSIRFTAGTGNDSILTDNGTLTLAGGIDFAADQGTNAITLDGPNGIAKIGKLATGESIRFTAGTSNDTLTTHSANLTLAGGIDFAADQGSNALTLDSPNGIAKIGKLVTGESIRFTAGTSGDTLTTHSSNLTLAGGIDFTADQGSNALTLDGPNGIAKIGKLATGESIRFTTGTSGDTLTTSSANLALAGGIDFAAGDGTNLINLLSPNGVLNIGKLAGGQSILFNGGSGSDDITSALARVTLAGGIEHNGAGGDNDLEFNDHGVVKIGKFGTGQSVKFTGTTDADSRVEWSGLFTLAGSFEMTGGANFDRVLFSIGTSSVGKNADGVSVLFNPGAGNSDIDWTGNTILAGFVDVIGGTGNDDIAFTGKVSVGKSAAGVSARFDGGDGNDPIRFDGNITLAGSVEMTGGIGNDPIQLFGKVNVGKSAAGVSVLLTGGDGNDTIELEGSTALAGSMTLDGGLNNDRFDLNDAISLTVNGAVELDGGAGNDRFELGASSFLFGSTLTIAGGDDDDDVTIIADGTIAGNVSVDLGLAVAGTQDVVFQSKSGLVSGLVFKGSLLVDADATNTTADTFTLTNVSVGGLIDLKLGGGISTVTIDNLIAGDEFKLDTRDGADVVNIERGDFFGNSVIKKLAAIQLGAGSDNLRIGSPNPPPNAGAADSTRVNFIGGLTTDGGIAGIDNRNLFENENDFGVPITPPTNFELATLV